MTQKTPRSVEAFIERYITKSRLETRQATQAAAEITHPLFAPCVTFSRESGSGGSEVAVEVARRLDFEFFDRKMTDYIANRAKVRKSVVESTDERTRANLQELIRDLTSQEYMSQSSYFRHLVEVISLIGERGNAVILGRGANFILAPEKILRVRVFAPLELRIERMTRRNHISHKMARSKVLSLDAERENFIRARFFKDPADLSGYDLAINTEYMSVDACADVVLEAFFSKMTPNLLRKGKLTSKQAG